MQIPQDFLSYEQKTLILVCDRGRAKFYNAFNRDFKLAEEIQNDRLELDDIEPYSTVAGGHLSKSQDENFKDREAKIFYKKLAKKIFDKKQTDDFLKLIIIIAHEDKNILFDELHEEVKQLLEFVIPEQLLKKPDDELVKIINKERKLIK
jgi:hypothetical protein